MEGVLGGDVVSSTPRWFMLRPCRVCVQSPEWGIGSLRAGGFGLRGPRGGSPPPQVAQHRGVLLLGAGRVTRGLATSEDHGQNTKRRKAFPEDTQGGGPPDSGGWGDAVMEASGS